MWSSHARLEGVNKLDLDVLTRLYLACLLAEELHTKGSDDLGRKVGRLGGDR